MDTSKGIEKYDHIASQGKVKKRVQALTRLVEEFSLRIFSPH